MLQNSITARWCNKKTSRRRSDGLSEYAPDNYTVWTFACISVLDVECNVLETQGVFWTREIRLVKRYPLAESVILSTRKVALLIILDWSSKVVIHSSLLALLDCSRHGMYAGDHMHDRWIHVNKDRRCAVRYSWYLNCDYERNRFDFWTLKN